jgi:hypothetical protein
VDQQRRCRRRTAAGERDGNRTRADRYSTYAIDNFCFERVISGWRGALTVLDLRLKK